VPSAGGRGARKGITSEQAVSVLDQNNQQRRVTITTGQSDGTYTEVTGGDLKDGDRLIVAEVAKAGATSNGGTGTQGGRGPGF
jgi:HlyD family secretion protein